MVLNEAKRGKSTMGLRFRKSIGLGHGFRINISKSGVGYSWGTRGFRITKTSNGRIRKTYSLYGTGLSYVEEYAPRKRNAQTTTPIAPSVDVLSADIEKFQSVEHTDIIRHITSILRWNMLCTILLWFVVVGVVIPEFLIIPIIGLIGKVIFRTIGDVELDYHFNDESEIEYDDRLNAWLSLNDCHKLWQVIAQRFNMNRKANAGAGRTVTKESIKIRKRTPFYLESNLDIITLKLKRETLIFLPDKLIIAKKTKAGAISYSDVKISVRAVEFVEYQRVPKDATILGYTWKYVNKNGSRDRRYSNNYQLPVCKYGKIIITSPQGLNVELQCSNYSIVNDFAERIKNYTNEV